MRNGIIATSITILLFMGVLLAFGGNYDSPEPIVALALFAPPLVAIFSALIPMKSSTRRVACVVTAILMVPALWLGIWGGWGLLYAIAIIVLLLAARVS